MPDLATAPMTIGAELDAAAALLSDAGVAEPRREANRLWAAIAGGRPGDAWLRYAVMACGAAWAVGSLRMVMLG